MGKSALIVYYSRGGENYVNGSIVNLDVGNTHVVAETLARLTARLMRRGATRTDRFPGQPGPVRPDFARVPDLLGRPADAGDDVSARHASGQAHGAALLHA